MWPDRVSNQGPLIYEKRSAVGPAEFNWYALRKSNSAVLIFCSLFNRGKLLRRTFAHIGANSFL